MKVPIGGICFLKQGAENSIRRLDKKEAIKYIIWQTTSKTRNVARLDKLLETALRLSEEIPIFELRNKPEPEAVLMSYDAMCQNS